MRNKNWVVSLPARYPLFRNKRQDEYEQNTSLSLSMNPTHVRDPRATVRFSLDERVWWDEGSRKLTGTIVGFTDDECMARVRLDSDGSVVHWPTLSSRMKRIQSRAPLDDQTMVDGKSGEGFLDTQQALEPVSCDGILWLK